MKLSKTWAEIKITKIIILVALDHELYECVFNLCTYKKIGQYDFL